MSSVLVVGYQRTPSRLLTDMDLDRELRRLTVLRARELAVVRRRAPGAAARTAREVLLRGGYAGRAPKTALPTRTKVAPSAMASSRSPLIPIDSSVAVGVAAARISSRSDRRRA